MISLVCLRAGPSRFALAVQDTGAVLAHEELEPLPSARPGVLGLLRDPAPGLDALPVLALGGTRGEHVVVVQGGRREPFGVLVDEVLGVVKVDDAAVAPPPRGQDDPLVKGVVGGAARGALLLDADVLGRRLDG